MIFWSFDLAPFHCLISSWDIIKNEHMQYLRRMIMDEIISVNTLKLVVLRYTTAEDKDKTPGFRLRSVYFHNFRCNFDPIQWYEPNIVFTTVMLTMIRRNNHNHGSTVSSTYCLGWQQRKCHSSTLLVFCNGNYRWPLDFLDKGPAMWKSLRWYDLTICLCRRLKKVFWYWLWWCLNLNIHISKPEIH